MSSRRWGTTRAPRRTRSALWRRWGRALASISPRVPRKVSSIFAFLQRASLPSCLNLLDRDLLLFSLGFRRLGQCQSEYAVLGACLDFVCIHAVGKLEGALEGAEAALRQIIVLFPLLLLFPLLALDGQEAVGELHP